MYQTQPYEQSSCSSSCQVAMHTCMPSLCKLTHAHAHTHRSLLFPKKFLPLVFSAWGLCVFPLNAGIPVCLHLFAQNKEEENKNIMKGLKVVRVLRLKTLVLMSMCRVCALVLRSCTLLHLKFDHV